MSVVERNLILTAFSEAGFDVSDSPLQLGPKIVRVKIDVGLSFDAVQSFRWLAEDPDLAVIGFDPLEQNISEVRKRSIERGYSDRFIALRLALGETAGMFPFFVTEDDAGSSSLFRPKVFGVQREEEVPVVTLASVMSFVNLEDFPRIDFLKTDCQGADISVLIGAGDFLSSVAIITCETETKGYEGTKNSERAIEKLLHDRGFLRQNPRSPFRQSLGKLLYGSAIVHVIHSRMKKLLMKLAQANSGVRPAIDTDDPTFINARWKAEIDRAEITAYQQG